MIIDVGERLDNGHLSMVNGWWEMELMNSSVSLLLNCCIVW